MITDSFIDSCLSLLLNDKCKIKKTKEMYNNILEILEFSEKRSTYEIPVDIRNKVDLLKKITTLFLSGKTLETIKDSISLSEKFKEFANLVDLKATSNISEAVFQDYVRQVRIRKKISTLFDNYDELNTVLESIKDGSFDCLDDLVEDYEVTIKKLYTNVMESQRSITIEAAASLDLMNDDFSHVTEMIKKKYDRENKTPTGFDLLDDRVFLGGFEPSRLYIVGGGSGAGKSTLLNNFIARSATINPGQNSCIASKYKKDEITRVYVYVTLENTIEESLMRIYMTLFNKTATDVLRDISNGVNIKKKLCDEFKKSGSNIVMKYFPMMTTSTSELCGVLDDTIEMYGKDAIAGLYVDYLDLLKSDLKYDLTRMELGHITQSLKSMAVLYNIPVITATQLGRRVYTIASAGELNLDQVSESIKKVENADCIILLARSSVDKNIVYGKIGKNRGGESEIHLEFGVDFSRFKFNNAQICSNVEKADNTSNQNNCECKTDVAGILAL